MVQYKINVNLTNKKAFLLKFQQIKNKALTKKRLILFLEYSY